MSIEAMKLALEALEDYKEGTFAKQNRVGAFRTCCGTPELTRPHASDCRAIKAITTLRQAIEQAEQAQPVMWGVDWGKAGDIPCVSIIKRLPDGGIEVLACEYAPYSYTSPPPRQPLSNEQICPWFQENTALTNEAAMRITRAIEAAHGIKGEV